MYRTYDNVKFSEKDSNESGRPIWLAGSALGDRCHVCAFFNNREEEDRVLLPFVQDGLERGEKIVHTIDPEQRGEHLERLAAGGIDVAPLLQNGRLELRTWSDTHLLDGYFDQRRTLKLFEGVEKNAKRQGFALPMVCVKLPKSELVVFHLCRATKLPKFFQVKSRAGCSL